MKEKLYTIPLNDALQADDECPLCYAEREIEQNILDFTLGNQSSYMERDIRAMTDEEGFCRRHFKEMFDYQNALGNAWILSTHLRRMQKELNEAEAKHRPGTTPMFAKFRKAPAARDGADARTDSAAAWAAQKEESCFICKQEKEARARMLDIFFEQWKKEPEFREKIAAGKGFCIPHFGELCEAAETRLPDSEKQAFYDTVFGLMKKSMERLIGDVDWMIEKYDYQNSDKPWKNSKDALQRAMQKLKGGYPADPAYRMKK